MAEAKSDYGKLDPVLISQLDTLRRIRNKLTHTDGRLESGVSISGIKGIYNCLNTVEITPEGCEAVLGIVERFVEQLINLEEVAI